MNPIVLAALHANVVNPTPVQPPGTAGIVTWFNYAMWVAMLLLSGSLMWGVVQVGASLRHGGEIEGVKRLMLSGTGLIVLGSFTLVLNAF